MTFSWSHFWMILHWIREHQASLAAWLTVLILSLTLVWAVVVEIPKLRRKLEVLSYEFKRGKNYKIENGQQIDLYWCRLEWAYSNVCRRPITPIDYIVETYSGEEPTSRNWHGEVKELHEGQHHSGVAYFAKWIDDNDLKSIIILDSMNKRHYFYYYNGKHRYKWLWHALHFLHIWR